MSHVRWRICVFATIFVQLWFKSFGQHAQNVISMTEDGWRPIIGTGQKHHPFHKQSENFQQTDPHLGKAVTIEIAKSSPIVFTSTFAPTISSNKFTESSNFIKNDPNNSGKKLPPHTKFPSQDYQTIQTIPSVALIPPHLAQKPLSRPPTGLIKKQPIAVIKTRPPFLNSKRKPLRGPSASHIEPFYHVAASNVFAEIKRPSNVKTRETPLGLLGSNHFQINQPHGQIEFNRYIIPPNNDAFQQFQSQPLFVFSNPSTDDFKKQNDEYTRHLVPPPPAKHNRQPVGKIEDSIQAVSQNFPKIQNSNQFGLRPPQFQENLIVQAQEQPFDFQKQFKQKEHATDVQVTKENFKDFHANLPGVRHPTGSDYVDFDFHTIATPGQLPKLQTYEVTEGKWVDNSKGFSFLPSKQQLQTKPPQTQRRPQIIQEPVVELNLPQFLPTPYKPDNAVPTSPTQQDISSVFSKVSSKLNKHRENTIANSPLHFDVKEVSTHYPIVGQPNFQLNTLTESPSTTEATSTKKPKLRRKPKPRRPSTTTTEQTITESSELQKLTDSTEEQTERPRKRYRGRPTHRTSTEDTSVQFQSEETNSERSRGRNRFKPAANYVVNEIKSRKRIRPSATNHKISDVDTGLIENKYKDQETYQTEYSDETTTSRIYNYVKDNNRIVHQGGEIRTDSSFVNNEINTGRPQKFMEDTTLMNSEFEENSSSISEDSTLEGVIITSPPSFEVIPTTTEILEKIEEFATTATTTTTTEVSTTTKPSRSRSKLKYNSSNRPRFSVKDYRQRLNQYTSTTPSSTTDFMKTTDNVRLRFPSRIRSRPTTSTTPQPDRSEGEENTEPAIKRRFRPKDPRHRTTTAESGTLPDDVDKYGSSRLRPSNRKSSDLKPKVSIRQNLFSTKRRPPLTLRNKYNKASEEITTTEIVETTETPIETSSDVERLVDTSEANTEFHSMEIPKTDLTSSSEETTTEALTEDEYSKRVSDLTSSFQNDYDTPGLFKSVSSNSRRVPNYFSISTEDPILPIEAFFPNLKDKE